MSLLLDTQILLWSQSEPERLPKWLADDLDDPSQAPVFSVVSIWEIVIKTALKRKNFDYDAQLIRSTLIELGWNELQLSGDHVLAVSDMPLLHGDPFDRVLVAQAKVEAMQFVTADTTLVDYGSHIRLL